MSLLNRGTETVTVYPEVVVTDEDGNTLTKPGSVGVVCRAVVQPLSTNETNAVTSGGRATAPGYINSSKYRLRLVGYPEVLGAQSAVEWRGKRFTLDGDPLIYTGSTRTAHVDYRISRT